MSQAPAVDRRAPAALIDRATLRATVETLAVLERPPCSPGEEQAARWLADRLRRLGADAEVEHGSAFHSFALPIAALSVVGAAAGALGLGGRRRSAAVLGLAAAGAIAEDVSNGPRLFRRLTMRPRETWNVVARLGDPAAERTVVVIAHHDAAPTGLIFDPSLQRALAERFPGLIERIDTSLPLWWPVVGFPALTAAGALLGRGALMWTGTIGATGAALALADIARSPVSPGANDNLSGVAGLVALAERLAAEPLVGARVLLVSCGAEESLQGGMRAFARRHFASLDRERTWVLNLESVGSPELMMLEGEGPMIMEDYPARGFRDRVARCAEEIGVHLRRGMRARSSTDSVIPSRAGFPTATLTSMDRHKSLTEYHRMTDTPERVDYETVAEATAVAEAVLREIAARGARRPGA